jgi:hypothetical protein
MSTNNFSIHHTISNRFETSNHTGWEFICPTCGYRTRYTLRAELGGQQLEVLDAGDPQARHTGSQTAVTPVESWSVTMVDDDDEAWLTDALRQQIEDLLDDVDLGDWEF